MTPVADVADLHLADCGTEAMAVSFSTLAIELSFYFPGRGGFYEHEYLLEGLLSADSHPVR